MSASPVVQTWSHLLLAASWQAAVLALLVLLCERMHWLRSPRVRHPLWWFVLLAPLALAPARLLLSQHHAVMHLPAPAAVTRVTEAVAAPSPLPVSAPVVPVTAGPTPAPAPPFPWRAALFAGWLLGCAAMALRLVVGHWRVRRMLHESTPVDTGAARRLLDELCAQAGVHAALRQSATVGAAMLCGLRRPTIIVPRQWLTDFAPTELRALLAHEVAHLRRRDLLAMLAQRVVEIPLFFHPAVWAAARFLAAAREELCDAWAIAQGADPAEYARCLTRAAARAQTRFPLASVGLAEGKSRLRQRVEAILGSGNSGAVSRRVAIALAAALLVSVVGFAAVTVAEREPASPLVLTNAALVDFTVLRHDGQPAANIAVMLYDAQERLHTVWTTDAQGEAWALFQDPSARTEVVFGDPMSGEVAHLLLDLSSGMHLTRTVTLSRSGEGAGALVDFGVLGADGKPSAASITLDDGRDVYAQIGRRRGGKITWGKGVLRAGAANVVLTGDSGKAQVLFAFPESETRVLVFAYRGGTWEAARVTLRLEGVSHTSQWVTLAPLPPEVGRPGQAVVDFSVFLPDGKPAAGASIILWYNEQTARHPVYTDAHGKATVVVESPTYKSEFRVTCPDPAHPGKLLGTTLSLFLDPGMHVSKIVALPAPETPLFRDLRGKIEELPWDGSAESVRQARELVAQADKEAGGADTIMWMHLGLRLYAGGRYAEALEAMKKVAERAGANQMDLFSSWVWQGQLLDLMGRRAEALAAYRKALEYVGHNTLTHSQWGMTLDRAWVEQRLQTPFRRPGASAEPEKDQAALDLTVLFRDGKPVPGATIVLQVQTTMQVFEHGEPTPRTGTRPYDLTMVLGKTDQHGKATVTIPPLGPGTPLLVVTYHDPRTGKDLTAKRLLALQPGTRTSATITIPSGAVQTIRSAPARQQPAA